MLATFDNNNHKCNCHNEYLNEILGGESNECNFY